MATVTQTITAEEFLAMDLGDGTFELVRGEVIEMPPPSPIHGRIATRSGYVFEGYGMQTGFGYVVGNDSAVLTQRDPDTVRGADISFYRSESWPSERLGQGLVPVPPLLVVEVLSPSNRAGDMLKKVLEYLAVGVAMVWLADPEGRRLIVYRMGDPIPVIYRHGEIIENVHELPGLRAAVADFFP